jgi:sporulation protein YlmC with PRC-barrel domain
MMSRNRSFLQQLRGYGIDAKDGQIGKITDSLFDDADWVVRYFVVDTGGWLLWREVLITPAACDHTERSRGVMVADLTRMQVENAPPVDLAKPVSRQYQLRLHTFYGWPVWHPREDKPVTGGPLGDAHLRSIRDVAGYHIQASDGEIGHVEDLLVDEETWAIEHMVVDTRNWLPGENVLVAPRWIDSISWSERKVVIDKRREEIKSGRLGPPYDPAVDVKRPHGKPA